MTHTFNEKKIYLTISCALALSMGSGLASAQAAPVNSGYLIDQRGLVAKSGNGLCWRTGYWTQAMAIPECEPDLMPPQPIAVAEPPVARVLTQTPLARVTERVVERVSERVSLDAGTLFDFDKDKLRPAGRSALDEFVGKLQSINPEAIIVVGHTDRIGSATYNQQLSERRAKAVKAYLVNKGIEPNRIGIEGKGEREPVTKAGECLGAKSAQIVVCLQPDRRVEVDVKGTQITTH